MFGKNYVTVKGFSMFELVQTRLKTRALFEMEKYYSRF